MSPCAFLIGFSSGPEEIRKTKAAQTKLGLLDWIAGAL
jgi:hypothetical protein